MPLPKPLSKSQIEAAQAATLSNKAASRYLHVSYQHYKKYAKAYGLFESHKNPSGKGIPKFLSDRKDKFSVDDIIYGRLSASHFTPEKLKYKMIEAGYLKEECAACGFKDRRVLDYKIPLLVNFRDGNSHNWTPENTELLCYNHYFLNVGNIFNHKEIQQMESGIEPKSKDSVTNWEVDDYSKKRLKELGLWDDEPDSGEYISRL